MLKQATTRGMAIAALCCVVLTGHAVAAKKKTKIAARPMPKARHVKYAFFASRLVTFHPLPNKTRSYPELVGPWNLGERAHPKTNDRRPNLYFVAPGNEHRVAGEESFDHNEVLSAVPNVPSYFDVYWVVVLDPKLKGEEFTGEQQILLATQGTFEPSENFEFDRIPSAAFLKRFLKITNLHELDKYRRPNGRLPRVAIIPAGFSVWALAEVKPVTENTAETLKNRD